MQWSALQKLIRVLCMKEREPSPAARGCVSDLVDGSCENENLADRHRGTDQSRTDFAFWRLSKLCKGLQAELQRLSVREERMQCHKTAHKPASNPSSRRVYACILLRRSLTVEALLMGETPAISKQVRELQSPFCSSRRWWMNPSWVAEWARLGP